METSWLHKLLQSHNIATTRKSQYFTSVILSSNESVESFLSLLPLVFQKEQDLEDEPSEWLCGFDAEFEKDKKIATIQISTRSLAGIIQCSLILKQEQKLSPKLFEFLSNTNIIKIGKGIFESDIPALCQTFPSLQSKQTQLQESCLDLGDLFFTVFGIAANLGLKPLGHSMLGIISKRPIKNRSTWSSQLLTKEMIDYAANDAWLGIELAHLAYDAGCIQLHSFTEWIKEELENISMKKKRNNSDSLNETVSNEKRVANRAVASAFSKLNHTGVTKNYAKEKLQETYRISTQIRKNNSNIQDLIQSMKRDRSEQQEELPQTKKQKRDKKNEETEDGFMFNIAKK